MKVCINELFLHLDSSNTIDKMLEAWIMSRASLRAISTPEDIEDAVKAELSELLPLIKAAQRVAFLAGVETFSTMDDIKAALKLEGACDELRATLCELSVF